MKPEVAEAWEIALSCFGKAQVRLRSGDRDGVVTECKNAISTACIAIKLAGFGDASSTFAGLFETFPSNPHAAIQKTRDALRNLRQMAPPEDPLPDVPS